MNDNEYAAAYTLQSLDNARTYAQGIDDWDKRKEIIEIIEEAKSEVMRVMEETR